MWKWMVLLLTAGLAAGCASSPPPPVTQTSYANPAPDIAQKPEKVVEPAPKKASQCRVFSDPCGVVPVYAAQKPDKAVEPTPEAQKPGKAAEPVPDKASQCRVFSDPCGVVPR
jgi:hypothetical protein